MIPIKFAYYINIGTESANIKCEFKVEDDEGQYHAVYEFSFADDRRPFLVSAEHFEVQNVRYGERGK